MLNIRKEHQYGSMVNICGLIAAGKSSLTKILSQIIREDTGFCEELYEPASKTNPLLKDYYNDPKRWGAIMQVYLLNKRLEQHRYAQSLALFGKSSVADSSIFNDTCFANMLEKDGTITHVEADVYFELFKNMSRELLYPTCFIYLDVSPDKALERIKKRIKQKETRKCESTVPKEYLEKLRAEYHELLGNLSRFSHVIRIDWNRDLDEEGIRIEAKNIWEQIKSLKETMPIPCQIGI